MTTIMSSIESIKHKLTDLEYKNICDELKDFPSEMPKVVHISKPSDDYIDNMIREKLSTWYVEDVENKLQERMDKTSWVEMRINQMIFDKLLPIKTELVRVHTPIIGVMRECMLMYEDLLDAELQKEVDFINEVYEMSDEIKQEYHRRFPDNDDDL